MVNNQQLMVWVQFWWCKLFTLEPSFMYFQEFDISTKKHIIELKEEFSGIFIFIASESQHFVHELIEIANNIGLNILICACPTINYLNSNKTIGFEIIPINLEKILRFNPEQIDSELYFLNLYHKKESKYGCAILEESFYLENELYNRLNELRFKSIDIYISKLKNSNIDLKPSFYTNQGKLKYPNLFLVFKNLENNLNDKYRNQIIDLLGNTLNSVNESLKDQSTIEFFPIC